MDFIAFDLETTGLSSEKNKIIEIAAVKFSAGKPVDHYVSFVNPETPIPDEITEITQISDKEVKDAPLIKDVLPTFSEFCGHYPMVAHNAPFDVQFLNKDFAALQIQPPKGLIIDTYSLSKKAFVGLPNYKLGTLVNFLKIPKLKFHRAKDDSIYCGHLFMEILKQWAAPRLRTSVDNLSLHQLQSVEGINVKTFPKIEPTSTQKTLF